MKINNVYFNINSLDKGTDYIAENKNENDASLKKVLEAFKGVVSSEEWNEMEQALKDLTAKEKEEIREFINEDIKPKLKELKDSIFDKEKRHEIIEKIKDKVHELMEKIKKMKENNEDTYENRTYMVLSTQAALLKVAAKS